MSNTATIFNMTRDINGYNGFGLQFSTMNYGVNLTGGAEQHFTVPSTGLAQWPIWIGVFSIASGGDLWVTNNGTAHSASGTGAFDVSCLNPTARIMKPGDVISLYTDDDFLEVCISMYAIREG